MVDKKIRFEFGKNWRKFLELVDESRIESAVESIKKMLRVESLVGKSFLDIGCGSGLFSLGARRLGARVHSFDYDPLCVDCAKELKERHYPDDPLWIIEVGDVLDRDYLRSLGRFDIVYCWGVVHHTGAMWQAMGNLIPLVAEGGKLYISIYNDQGNKSRRWAELKKSYNRCPRVLRGIIVFMYGLLLVIRSCLVKALKVENPFDFTRLTREKKNRGMSFWHDLIDWVGGYPFEVAKPEEVFSFFHENGFELIGLKTCGGGLGCNEYVFRKS